MASLILTVSELTRQIKTLLEERFPFVWVEGEISNLTLHSTGHYFFTLKDEKAQIRAVMFRSQAQHLPFKPENGVHVVVRGRIGVYELRGEYQILTDFMEPLRKGSLQLAFEQTKKKLETEGLFDLSRKKPLPLLPRKIVIITSPTGAAIKDILRLIDQRFANLEILIIPVRVQGAEAPGEIIAALELVNSIARADVVILGRGGGSIEDLWTFNDEGVARAIARCPVPVVSAIGHETDFTIADFVADVRAPTPSAAAQLVVERKEHLVKILETLRARMEKGFCYPLKMWKNKLEMIRKGLGDPRKRLVDLNLRNDELSQRLLQAFHQSRQNKAVKWQRQHEMLLLFSPLGNIKVRRQELYRIAEKLRACMEWRLGRWTGALDKSMARLDGVSPLNVLKRGYSITRTWPEKGIVRDVSTLHLHQHLNIKLQKGEFFCRVEETKEDGESINA